MEAVGFVLCGANWGGGAGIEFFVPPEFRVKLLYCPSREENDKPILFGLFAAREHLGLLRADRVMDTARSFKPHGRMPDGWQMPVGIFDDSDCRIHNAYTRLGPDWHYYGVNMFALYLPDSVVDGGSLERVPASLASLASLAKEPIVRMERGASSVGTMPFAFENWGPG